MQRIGRFTLYDLPQTESTNDEAKRLLSRKPENLVATALEQTNGRGRRGRSWVSETGNLFCSMTLQIDLKDLGQIVILSGLAVAETILGFAPLADVRVKWPNDVLVNGCKISGILFENAEDSWWITGVGINIVSSPEKNMMYPTVSLKALGVRTDRLEVLKAFVEHFESLYKRWQNEGFETIRKSWLDKAYKHSKKITVKQEDQCIDGIFETIDENGSLILRLPTGVQKIIVGDVF
jgi:BirA family biotin operon repressor/biotin-[acetyl-CoA-carboxylase] ligase